MKKIIELATGDTTSSTVAGTATSPAINALEPALWARNIIDGAKAKRFFEQVAVQQVLPQGHKDWIAPKRKFYLGSMTDNTTEGGAITFTQLDNLDGVRFTPSIHGWGISLSNHAMRVNAVNLVTEARNDLTDYYARQVDVAIRDAIEDDDDTNITDSDDSGFQEVFGGDATSEATLSAGDILTTDVLADARERLMSGTAKYYSSGTLTDSTGTKNPWFPEPNSPFVFFIAPEQETAFLKDSQFTNAAEYGSQEVLLNGEIGKYLGVKILSTTQVSRHTDWGSGSLVGHATLMVKAMKCAGLAWGLRLRVHAFDFPSELERRIILETSYASAVIHPDSCVRVKVTDS